jgi:hypothetical protein
MPPIKSRMWRSSFALIVAAISLTSCGSLPSLNGESQQVRNEQAIREDEIGTGGQLISIQSDNVRAAGYDATSLVMTVQFDNGAFSFCATPPLEPDWIPATRARGHSI